MRPRRGWLLERGAVGRLQAAVEQLLADLGTLAAAVRLLLDRHFTPVLAELICAAVDLDILALDLAGSGGTAQAGRLRPRRRGFDGAVRWSLRSGCRVLFHCPSRRSEKPSWQCRGTDGHYRGLPAVGR
jgi:hypothetical protein